LPPEIELETAGLLAPWRLADVHAERRAGDMQLLGDGDEVA